MPEPAERSRKEAGSCGGARRSHGAPGAYGGRRNGARSPVRGRAGRRRVPRLRDLHLDSNGDLAVLTDVHGAGVGRPTSPPAFRRRPDKETGPASAATDDEGARPISSHRFPALEKGGERRENLAAYATARGGEWRFPPSPRTGGRQVSRAGRALPRSRPSPPSPQPAIGPRRTAGLLPRSPVRQTMPDPPMGASRHSAPDRPRCARAHRPRGGRRPARRRRGGALPAGLRGRHRAADPNRSGSFPRTPEHAFGGSSAPDIPERRLTLRADHSPVSGNRSSSALNALSRQVVSRLETITDFRTAVRRPTPRIGCATTISRSARAVVG